MIVAIDPGHERSAWLSMDENGLPVEFDIVENEVLRRGLLRYRDLFDKSPAALIIEQVASYGMAVGREVFETVYWSGRFHEAAWPVPVHRMPRLLVKMHLCRHASAKDSNIRQALIDLYGGKKAKGTKAAPGPLYGISKDVWSALALARTFHDSGAPRA